MPAILRQNVFTPPKVMVKRELRGVYVDGKRPDPPAVDGEPEPGPLPHVPPTPRRDRMKYGTMAGKVLAMLAIVADAQAPCPTNAEIARETGAKASSHISPVIKRLVGDGLIEIDRVKAKGAAQRRIRIVSSGKWTGFGQATIRNQERFWK